MRPARLLAIMFTITTTLVVYRGYREAPDAVRWATIYVIAVVVPWALAVLHQRQGVAEGLALELLILPQLTLQVAAGLVERSTAGTVGGGWPSWIPPAVGVALIVITYVLTRNRIVR